MSLQVTIRAMIFGLTLVLVAPAASAYTFVSQGTYQPITKCSGIKSFFLSPTSNRTIGETLSYAKLTLKACSVRIYLGSGTYSEDVSVGIDSELIGFGAAVISGQITNHGSSLTLRNLELRNSAGVVLWSEHSNADNILRNVVISNAKNWAIYQKNGALSASGLQIERASRVFDWMTHYRIFIARNSSPTVKHATASSVAQSANQAGIYLEDAGFDLNNVEISNMPQSALIVRGVSQGDISSLTVTDSGTALTPSVFGGDNDYCGFWARESCLWPSLALGAVSFQNGASVVVNGLAVQGASNVAVAVSGTGTFVRGNMWTVANNDGRGIAVGQAGNLVFGRSFLNGNRNIGLIVAGEGSHAELINVDVVNTESDVNGLGGRGIEVQRGASLEVSQSRVLNNREFGVLISDSDTMVALNESQVSGTRAAECATNSALTCPVLGQGFGDGVVVLGGADLSLQEFTITNNARVGLYLYETTESGLDDAPTSIIGAPTLAAQDGTITGNDYGISFRRGTISPSSFAGAMVACYDNAMTIDGCYSDIQLEVPSLADTL